MLYQKEGKSGAGRQEDQQQANSREWTECQPLLKQIIDHLLKKKKKE